MFPAEFVDGIEHLLDLVRFREAFVLLDVDPGIASPRHPIDPMTGNTEWGKRSWQDDPTSDSWSGDDLFDVYSKSQDTALDGTKYKDW